MRRCRVDVGGEPRHPRRVIREDYVLAWIRRYVQWLVEIVGLVRAQDYEAALRRIDILLRTLLDLGPDAVASLTEGQILARLTLGDPPSLVQERCAVIAAALRQLGIVAAAQQRPDTARDCFLKALHLALGLRLQGGPTPLEEYVPAVDDLLEHLKPFGLPSRTWAALMLYHEQHGRYDKAEDALFALLEAAPADADAHAIGLGFYTRISALSDERLAAGGLPRDEVLSGLAEIRRRQQHSA
jgi:tetratricopeptide (TPR) repeat protein